MTPERIIEILESVSPTIVSKEVIPNTNDERPLHLMYFAQDGIISKKITYQYPVDNGAWASIKKTDIHEVVAEDVPTFREINISNHPTLTDVTRTVNLAHTDIRKDKIVVTVVIKHSNNIPDIVVPLAATNDMKVDGTSVGLGSEVGERDYWEYMTNDLKVDIYTLFDNRIPELDNQGRFNNIY